MEKKLQVFENEEFGKVRVLEMDGQPWFVGKDVADILNYRNTRDALKKHVDEEDKADVAIHDGSQNRNMTVINESGLYSLILSSKLPQAKKFKRWVTSEVLPSIRRHGAYITGETLEKMLQSSEFTSELLNKLLAEREENTVLREHIEALAPKARYYDLILQSKNAVQVSVIAKDYGMTAVSFNRLLHDLGIQFKLGGTWLLYQGLAGKGYTCSRTYHVNEERSVMHTYWTQAGRLFLYKTLKENGIIPLMEDFNAAGL
ncbi:BRO family protein [Geosporobacter ferrireducens]|nr:phage antirepressor KilAC domain-containing protein [Geosporobacter ferrireducens]